MGSWSIPQLKLKRPSWRRKLTLLVAVILLALAILKACGVLEALELRGLDWLMRNRPVNDASSRVTLVVVSDRDILTTLEDSAEAPTESLITDLTQNLTQNFAERKGLADAVDILQAYSPRVIGINSPWLVFNQARRAKLKATLGRYSNIVSTDQDMSPAPGFYKILVDKDERVRRLNLVEQNPSGELAYAFPLQLAKLYLAKDNILLNPIESLGQPIRFGKRDIAPLPSDLGSSYRIEQGGTQVLLDLSAAAEPSPVLSLEDVLGQTFAPELVRDRIIIIATTSHYFSNTFSTAALSQGSSLPLQASQTLGNKARESQQLYDIEINARATEQLLNIVLKGTPQIRPISTGLTYGLIILCGALGTYVCVAFTSLGKALFGLTLANIFLIATCMSALSASGWWLPIVAMSLALNASGLAAAYSENYARKLVEQQQLTIEKTFEAVHNGPLQTLALLSRRSRAQSTAFDTIASDLETLDCELRALYRFLENQSSASRDLIHFSDTLTLNATAPLSEMLFHIFEHTLNRPFPVLRSLKAAMTPDFSPLDTCPLSKTQKRGICLFLEESLCNVGKYGFGATYVNVICRRTHNEYSIEVVNNSTGKVVIEETYEGYGTYQATRLANNLGGQFRRFSGPNNTLHCQLKWPVQKKFLWFF